MIERLLLEDELLRSSVLLDHAQAGEIADIVMDMIRRGLIGECGSKQELSPAGNRRAPPDGRLNYCNPGYDHSAAKRSYLVKFDDPDVQDQVFYDEQEARAFFEAAIANWNCYLFGLLER